MLSTYRKSYICIISIQYSTHQLDRLRRLQHLIAMFTGTFRQYSENQAHLIRAARELFTKRK